LNIFRHFYNIRSKNIYDTLDETRAPASLRWQAVRNRIIYISNQLKNCLLNLSRRVIDIANESTVCAGFHS